MEAAVGKPVDGKGVQVLGGKKGGSLGQCTWGGQLRSGRGAQTQPKPEGALSVQGVFDRNGLLRKGRIVFRPTLARMNVLAVGEVEQGILGKSHGSKFR